MTEFRAPLSPALAESIYSGLCGAPHAEFGSHKQLLKSKMDADSLPYFLFGFLAPDFLPSEDLGAEDFFEPPLESDFSLALTDFDADDFL